MIVIYQRIVFRAIKHGLSFQRFVYFEDVQFTDVRFCVLLIASYKRNLIEP